MLKDECFACDLVALQFSRQEEYPLVVKLSRCYCPSSSCSYGTVNLLGIWFPSGKESDVK